MGSFQLLELLFAFRYCTGQVCDPKFHEEMWMWLHHPRSGSRGCQGSPRGGFCTSQHWGRAAQHQLNIPPQRLLPPAPWFSQLFNWNDSFPSTTQSRFKWDIREEQLIISLHSICSPESGGGELILQDPAQAAASQIYVRKMIFFSFFYNPGPLNQIWLPM